MTHDSLGRLYYIELGDLTERPRPRRNLLDCGFTRSRAKITRIGWKELSCAAVA